ncbi:MAG: UvrD-helicase domain-containing protein [Planctomycetales bacterium]|nr:UvrD-helicase domain-containing protein [Planctomycetales bacterium]
MEDHLENLTDAQRSAVEHQEGPLLILAGPGSGKTRVITCRTAHLIHADVPDSAILALTFTNKAADEMRQRVRTLVPWANVWMSTFHRFCSQLLRRMPSLVGLEENFTIYDSGDSLRLLKDVIEESGSIPTHHSPAQIQHAISDAKNRLLTAEQLTEAAKSPVQEVAAKYYPYYQQRLISSNAVDFDDLLMHVAQMLIDNPEIRAELDAQYQFVMVDEYQDTNYAQYCIVRGLSVDRPNLAVTGDPDQAIYGWRGADIQNIMSFERDYPNAKVVRLEQNYRSTPQILDAANRLISNNRMRKEKILFTDRPPGDPVRLMRYDNGEDEASDIVSQIASAVEKGERKPSDFAILYRVNALSRNFEHVLREFGLAYQIVNGVEFYQRKEIKDVLAYLQLVNNPRDRMAFLRIVNTPPRGIGKKSLQRISDFGDRQGISLLQSARSIRTADGITKRVEKSLQNFVKAYDQLAEDPAAPVEELVGLTLSVTGYEDHLRESHTEEDSNRLANVQELMTAAKEFDERMGDDGGLDVFLEQAALVNDTDAWENDSDKVTLMTLHAAKGLEFPVIYIVAVENGIIPHARSKDNPGELEEERRLMFVGITRAQDRLQVSFTNRRAFRGRMNYSVPSSFLMELPRESMDLAMNSAYAMQRRAYNLDSAQVNDAVERGYAEETADSDYVQDSVAADPQWADDDGVPRQARERSPSKTSAQDLLSKVTTAAAIAGEETSSAHVDPEQFAVGMLVQHPKQGPGKIIALSGANANRRARVRFIHPAEEHTYVLAFSQLRPLGPVLD